MNSLTTLTGVPRIDSKIQIDAGGGEGEPCWMWIGADDGEHGYGRVYNDGRTQVAHRVVYEIVRGPIPDGLTLDHLCRTPSCVNPGHLEPVTIEENRARAVPHHWSKRISHCPQGHEYTSDNSLFSKGKRSCRECMRARSAAISASKRGQRVACVECGESFHYASLRRHAKRAHAKDPS